MNKSGKRGGGEEQFKNYEGGGRRVWFDVDFSFLVNILSKICCNLNSRECYNTFVVILS